MSEFFVTVLFGSDQIAKFNNKEVFNEIEILEYTKFYSFETEKELNAFIFGLEEASGWLDLIYVKGLKFNCNILIEKALSKSTK